MSSLLSCFEVFPHLYNHLSAFGKKTFAKDEGYGRFDLVERLQNDDKLILFGELEAIEPL